MKREVRIGEHARKQASLLIERLGKQVEAAAADAGPEAIHDVRVAIRRLGQCLRAFEAFYPAKRRKRVRRRLREMMDLAGEVRNRDMALELLAAAGVPERAGVARQLAAERARAERKIRQALARWQRRGIPDRWRAQLELNGQA